MKLERDNNLDITTVGDFDSIESNISLDSLPFLFEMISKNFYSDPIGSIVREITSNCVDAHTESGTNEPVIIGTKHIEDEDTTYIYFKDYGLGMSPDTIRNIYMNWWTSSKRHTNDLIGGFGIGSKTPLSYADYFYVITIHDNQRYTYILHKGEKKPTLDLLSLEDVEEVDGKFEHGTEIRIPLKSDLVEVEGYYRKLTSKEAFRLAILKQLAYFDKVYVHQSLNVDNNYTIYETNTFKFRVSNPFDSVHIVYGNVYYPLNRDQLLPTDLMKSLGIGYYDLPNVGIKIDIGEVKVTPNRESIIYNEEAKEVISNKIDAFIRELREIYSNQNKSANNIFDYMQRKKNNKYIVFKTKDDVTHSLKINKNIIEDIDVIYAPLPKHRIPDNPFLMYEVLYDTKTKLQDYNRDQAFHRIKDFDHIYITTEGHVPMSKLVYLEELHNRFLVIRRKKIKHKHLRYLCSELNLNYAESSRKIEYVYLPSYLYERNFKATDSIDLTFTDTKIIYTLQNISSNTFSSTWNIDGSNNTEAYTTDSIKGYKRSFKVIEPYTFNKSKHILEFIKQMDKEVDAISEDINSVEVPEDWLEEYRESIRKTDYAKLRRAKGNILCKFVNFNNNTKYEVSISDLEDAQLVICSLYENNNVHTAYNLFRALGIPLSKPNQEDNKDNNVYHYNLEKRKNALKSRIYLITTAQTHLNKIKKLPNVVSTHRFLKQPPAFLHKGIQQLLILDRLEKSNIDRSVFVKPIISKYYFDLWHKVKKAFHSKRDTQHIPYCMGTLTDLKLKPYSSEYEKEIEELIEMRNKLDILEYVLTHAPTEYVRFITSKLKVTKLNEDLYKSVLLTNELKQNKDEREQD